MFDRVERANEGCGSLIQEASDVRLGARTGRCWLCLRDLHRETAEANATPTSALNLMRGSLSPSVPFGCSIRIERSPEAHSRQQAKRRCDNPNKDGGCESVPDGVGGVR